MKLRWQDLKHRVNGFSTPLGGLQWTPPPNERDLCRELITFLENRRVLYVESEAEVPQHAALSIIEMRDFLTGFIIRCPEGSAVEQAARQMRASCAAFHRGASSSPDILDFGAHQGHWASWVFLQSLGMMRSQIGTQMAIIAARYRVGIEEHMMSIMPPDVTNLESDGFL